MDETLMERAGPAQGLPADLAAAVSQVMGGIKALGKDATNQHAKYDFASIDKFLAAVNPLCAAAGLIVLQDEDHIDIRPGAEGKTGWLFARYRFVLAHKSGVAWGPMYRTVMVQAQGAQAFGSAQSYALKQFLRSLFQIATGDQDDADLKPAETLPQGASMNGAARTRKPAPPQEPNVAAARDKFTALRNLIKSEKDTDALDRLYDGHSDDRKFIAEHGGDEAAKQLDRLYRDRREFLTQGLAA